MAPCVRLTATGACGVQRTPGSMASEAEAEITLETYDKHHVKVPKSIATRSAIINMMIEGAPLRVCGCIAPARPHPREGGGGRGALGRPPSRHFAELDARA